ncbi:MAG: class I SAM-dependent methyltransferase [Symploca sp. SIO2D2]|nr:class I SAM-dependent methyltransferase [Symploca sp. SIO2D2]
MQKEQNLTGFSTMSSAIEFADNYNNWILEIFKPYIKENILEIGTGQGNFKRYLTSIKNYISLDIDSTVIERAQQRDSRGQYILANIADPTCLLQLQSFQVDTVLCTNVLEHIQDDRVAIENMVEILQDKGHLLLFVPAFPSLYSSMDRLAGHCRRYTKTSLVSLFQDTPTKVEKLEYFNPIGGLGWWVNKFFGHKNLDNTSINQQIVIFDKYIVPISKLSNWFAKSFFGQSLICVISKQASQ